MTSQAVQNLVSDAIEASAGTVRTGEDLVSGNVFSFLVNTGELTPAWWTPARDQYLRKTWRSSSHLALAVYNAQSKLVGIPPRIVPRDKSSASRAEAAIAFQERITIASQLGEGWNAAIERFYEDLLTQDNGGFLEIIGDGEPDGPIVGMPYGIIHRESSRCTRTGNQEYPVVYQDISGKRYKYHWTRIVYMSQMPSPIATMNGVGFCPVSRCIEVARTLVDIVRYKQERLGSRPHNRIIYGAGFTGNDIMTALRMSSEEADNSGLSRYALTVAIGTDRSDAKLGEINMTHLEPFDEETSVTLGMYVIAYSFGMDVSEIWHSQKSGGNTDARIQQARTRGKLPSQVTSALAVQLNTKMVPSYLEMVFDFKDDEEDQQKAVIDDIRARSTLRLKQAGAIDERGSRIMMVNSGSLSRDEMVDMEAKDGRLDDGSSIGVLFYDNHPDYVEVLRIPGVDYPTDFLNNDPVIMMSLLSAAQSRAMQMFAGTSSSAKKSRLRMAMHALDWAMSKYRAATISSSNESDNEGVAEEQDERDEESQSNREGEGKDSYT